MINKQITNKSLFLFSLLTITLLNLFSCKGEADQAKSVKVQSGIWEVNETIELSFNISQIDKYYNLFIDVNIYEDFSTDNLWLFVESVSPSGNNFKDTIMYYIADGKGKWFGEKKGEIIENKFMYKSNIQFVEPGTYKFLIKHGMRENQLPKTSEVGISLNEYISAETE